MICPWRINKSIRTHFINISKMHFPLGWVLRLFGIPSTRGKPFGNCLPRRPHFGASRCCAGTPSPLAKGTTLCERRGTPACKRVPLRRQIALLSEFPATPPSATSQIDSFALTAIYEMSSSKNHGCPSPYSPADATYPPGVLRPGAGLRPRIARYRKRQASAHSIPHAAVFPVVPAR